MSMNDPLARAIGERARLQRIASRRTKTVVAGLAGITPEYLYQIERGQKLPTVAVLTQLATALGVSVGELVEGQPARAPARAKSAAGDALYRALTSPPIDEHAPPALPQLSRDIAAAWTTWQTSPRRYTQVAAVLPRLIADTEQGLRQSGSDTARASQRCAADLYGLVRTVAKRVGRSDVSLLAADRAVRAAEAADDPLRLASAHWNLTQVLLADGQAEGAEDVALRAAGSLESVVRQGNADAVALYGSLLLIGAVAAVRRGDAWTARARLDQAAPLADQTGEHNIYWTAFGPTNVAMFAVSVEVESGEAVEGLRMARQVAHDRSPSIERRVAFLLDQAKGYQLRRDYNSALRLLGDAEREAPEDLRHRPAAHAILRTVVQRGGRTVAGEAAGLALRIGLPV
ncbi:Helix-turn-helix domain-containing protein [Actinokineospora alba]|nr:Helix-turn-helix domain-containing protein [Actinokineospora alba]